MSRSLKPSPVKPNTNQQTARAPVFDPAMFLATAAVGRDISKYSKKKIIFAQGDDADAVFYIKKGKVKVAVISDEGKEAILPCWGRTSLSVKDVWSDSRNVWRPRQQ